MKAVLELTRAITDWQYRHEQFQGNGNEKNILFVAPQLSSKHLYKIILPFFNCYTPNIHTAITSLGKFNPYEQLVHINDDLTEKQIKWANFIVFPFTAMDLNKPNGIYQAIREVNSNCKIVFLVDFNFYQLPPSHPHKQLFDTAGVIDTVERNILYSDICMTSNKFLMESLYNTFSHLMSTKFKDVAYVPVVFKNVPYLIDPEIVLQNVVESEINTPVSVLNKGIFKKISDKAEEIKQEDLENNKNKKKKLANKKQTPQKASTKTKKVSAKDKKTRGRPRKNPKNDVEEAVELKKTEEQPVAQTPIIPVKQLARQYRIGIICSPNNYHDIQAYNEQFRLINQQYGDAVTLLFIGYDYDEDKQNILDGVNFEYTKQVSIIHYFKQLESLKLDMVFIPMDRIAYNFTSENSNKYLECSLFKIPVLVDNLYPYNQMIINERNGFICNGKIDLIQRLDGILSNPDLLKMVGNGAYNDVITNYTFVDMTIDVLSGSFT